MITLKEKEERWARELSRLAIGFSLAVIAFDLCLFWAGLHV